MSLNLAHLTKPDQEFDPDLRAAGWAPGNYLCKCHDCAEIHQADKRARCCVPCARKIVAEDKLRREEDPIRAQAEGVVI